MAISQEQKVDFLLKKIGFTASKTGNATDATGLTGTLTPKAGFAEAIPSPLISAKTAVWNERVRQYQQHHQVLIQLK